MFSKGIQQDHLHACADLSAVANDDVPLDQTLIRQMKRNIASSSVTWVSKEIHQLWTSSSGGKDLRQCTYPILSKMARDVMADAATGAGVEREFNIQGESLLNKAIVWPLQQFMI